MYEDHTRGGGSGGYRCYGEKAGRGDRRRVGMSQSASDRLTKSDNRDGFSSAYLCGSVRGHNGHFVSLRAPPHPHILSIFRQRLHILQHMLDAFHPSNLLQPERSFYLHRYSQNQPRRPQSTQRRQKYINILLSTAFDDVARGEHEVQGEDLSGQTTV